MLVGREFVHVELHHLLGRGHHGLGLHQGGGGARPGAVLYGGRVVLGTLEGCAVAGGGVPCGGSDMGQGGHAVGVHVAVAIGVSVTIGGHPIGRAGHAGHAAVAHYAAVHTHAVTIVTGSGSGEQCPRSSDQFALERWQVLSVTEVVGVVGATVALTDGDTGSASIGVDIGQQASSAGQGHVDQQTRLQQQNSSVLC